MWLRFLGIKILIEAQHFWSSTVEFYTITEGDSGSYISSLFAFHFVLAYTLFSQQGRRLGSVKILGDTLLESELNLFLTGLPQLN